ncbi:hypothetical protein [Janthinobacterium sp. RB2R34]|uniref:hypothetical protein n=1 Tax=Janthinobacterium sp. RB2R34 TaxID=3424193 RepID=UPI003F26E6AA
MADNTTISTLAGRLSAAAEHTSTRLQGLDHQALQDQLIADDRKVFYELDAAHKSAAAQQVPQPEDKASASSATAATDFVNGKKTNPFAGLSREQLSTISHDESGTFTINERRAAATQAYREEEAWRQQVVSQAMQEYNSTGKMTKFFGSVLDHFNALPPLEQATYPENYASDLQDKIKLDFNYYNHSAGDAGPTPGSIADITNNNLFPAKLDLFELLGVKLKDWTSQGGS